METKRPGSLVAVVKPLSSTDSSKELLSADEIITLPSPMPSPMERSGSSLIGDPQLPVPDEFCDGPSISSCEEDDDRRVSYFFSEKKKEKMTTPFIGYICLLQHLSPVPGAEAAMRSRARLSHRLCSVPEKHSVVSFVHDIR